MPISVSATDKVGQVFQVLMTANILSAPVYDEKAKDHVSIIDIMDILASSIMLDEQKELGKAFAEALLSALKDKDKEIPDISTLISQQSLFKNVEVRDIANLSERNPFICLPDTASIYDVIQAFQRDHVHRVGLKDKEGKLVAYISESAVLAYIVAQKKSELSKKRMDELNVHNLLPHPKQIISVKTHVTALQAFRQMHMAHVSGVPVLDDDGKVVAHISAKDLKLIGSDASAWQLVHMPVLEYLKSAKTVESKFEKLKRFLFSSSQVISFVKEDEFATVVQRLIDSRVHRIYYTDKHHVLYGIVSIKDMLAAIAGTGRP